MRDPRTLAKATLAQLAVFLLDAFTPWVMLLAVGQPASFAAVLPAFILASVAASLGPIPLGLGTFEATCIAVLASTGVAVEGALAATLLLRGFTVWLPMLPGLWFTRETLRPRD